MSCCNNPSVQYRSPEDKRMLAVYCPIAEKANTYMFYNWRVCDPLNQEVNTLKNLREGYSSCGDAKYSYYYPIDKAFNYNPGTGPRQFEAYVPLNRSQQ